MKIEYLVSSMIFTHREDPLSLESQCRFLRSRGLGIELRPNVTDLGGCRFSPKYRRRLKKAAAGMTVSLQARSDKPTLEKWLEQIECAKDLNASIVADIHSLGLTAEAELDDCDLARQAVAMTIRRSVKLFVETGPLDIMLELAERFPSISYCLDTGYINADQKHDFTEYVDKLGPRTGYLHLSDNYGDADDNVSPGLTSGISRQSWDYLLAELDSRDRHIIASFEMAPPSPQVMLAQACDFMFNDLNWPNRPDCPEKLEAARHSRTVQNRS